MIMCMAAGGFYLYNEVQKLQGPKSEKTYTSDEDPIPEPTVDDSGQVNITEQGSDAFQQIDRTFAYPLLLKAHSDVTDFDSLTDSDLAQLLSAINIDPDVLRTHMTKSKQIS